MAEYTVFGQEDIFFERNRIFSAFAISQDVDLYKIPKSLVQN